MEEWGGVGGIGFTTGLSLGRWWGEGDIGGGEGGVKGWTKAFYCFCYLGSSKSVSETIFLSIKLYDSREGILEETGRKQQGRVTYTCCKSDSFP